MPCCRTPHTLRTVYSELGSINCVCYTDGSYLNGIGGWGALVCRDDGVFELCGGQQKQSNITSVRMELIAVMRALEATPKQATVTVISDCKSIMDTANSYQRKWKKDFYPGQIPRADSDIWQSIRKMSLHRNVTFQWVRGHSGIEGNVQADRLARSGWLCAAGEC